MTTITPKLTVDTVPPTSPPPTPGDLWYNSATGYTLIYYDDGNTIQWVVTNPGSGTQGPQGPQGPAGPPGTYTSGVGISAGGGVLAISDTPPVGSAMQALSGPYVLATRAQARAITSTPPALWIAGITLLNDGWGGTFDLDPTDTTTVDDGAMTIVNAVGNRYKRRWDTQVLRPKWFGAVEDGVADDSNAWAALATYNGNLTKKAALHFTGRTVLGQTNTNNLPVIDGLGIGEILALPAMAGTAPVLTYTGNGWPVMQNFKVTMPIYTSGVGATLGGGSFFSYVPAAGTGSGVTIRGVTVTGGGERGMHFHAVANIDVDNCFVDRCFGDGIGIVNTQDTLLAKTQNIRITRTRMRMTGGCGIFCLTNGTDVNRNATRDVHFSDIQIEGCGWISQQAGLAIAGGPCHQVFVDVNVKNSQGGLSIKRNVNYTLPTPNINSNMTARVTSHTNIDTAYAFNITHAGGGLGSTYGYQVNVNTTFQQAQARQASTHYMPGDVVCMPTGASTGLSNYICLLEGTTASGAGPNGRTPNTPMTDGTCTWLFLIDVALLDGSSVQVPNTFIAFRLNGSMDGVQADIKAYNVSSFATLFSDQAGDTQSNIVIRAQGTCCGSAITDSATRGAYTIDKLTLDHWDVVSDGRLTNPGLITLGDAGNTLTNLVVDGGNWRGTTPWFRQRIGTSSVSGRIGGAPTINCVGTLIFAIGFINLLWDGSGYASITGANTPVLSGSGSPSGTIEISNPLRVDTDAAMNTTNFRGWPGSLGILTFNTRMNRGYANAVPVGGGTYGDMFRINQPTPTILTGWQVTTPSNTAATWTAY